MPPTFKRRSGFSSGRGQLLHFIHVSGEGAGVKKSRGKAAAPVPNGSFIPRSGRVGPFKTCTTGRWVTSTALYCFQLPACRRGSREACKPRCEGVSRFRNVGLKEPITHRAGDPVRSILHLFVRKETFHKLVVDQVQLFIAVQGGQQLLAVLLHHLHDDQAVLLVIQVDVSRLALLGIL